MPPNYRKAVFEDLDHVQNSRNDLRTVLERRTLERTALPKLFIACGTEDLIYPSNIEFYETLKIHSFEVTFEKHPGIHNWDFWDLYIKDVLDWLPLKCDVVE